MGVAYLHEHDIVHGNLRAVRSSSASYVVSLNLMPQDNVLIDNEMNVKIAGFGSAAFIGKQGHVTHQSAPNWRAPELLKVDGQHPASTCASDVYSFGCLCVEVRNLLQSMFSLGSSSGLPALFG